MEGNVYVENIVDVMINCTYDVLYIMLISPVQIILVTCNDSVQLIDTNNVNFLISPQKHSIIIKTVDASSHYIFYKILMHVQYFNTGLFLSFDDTIYIFFFRVCRRSDDYA